VRFLPIFLDLSRRHVVLVGASPALDNKVRLVLAAAARVRWYAAAVDKKYVDEMHDVEITARLPVETDLDGAAAVILAAGDPLDRTVSSWARARALPVNVVDRPELSTFIMPAIVDRGDVVVAVGTSGSAPVLARRIRERIEALLPARVGELAALLGEVKQLDGQADDDGRLQRIETCLQNVIADIDQF